MDFVVNVPFYDGYITFSTLFILGNPHNYDKNDGHNLHFFRSGLGTLQVYIDHTLPIAGCFGDKLLLTPSKLVLDWQVQQALHLLCATPAFVESAAAC